MKILDLYLHAFGPFTATHFELSSQETGLVLLHGENEAGKSSTLRGLRGLLFGIPHNSADSFVHAPKDLRIGARLQLDHGEELEFTRRKGRDKTLLSASTAEPLPDSALAPFLCGLSQEVFHQAFAIDHPGLLRGGESLLEAEGDVAQSIFGAGLGSTNLRAVLTALEGETKALFLPRASKPKINAAIANFKALQKEAKQHSLGASTWRDLADTVLRLSSELEATETKFDQTNQEKARLERVRSSAPLLRQRQELEQKLSEYAAVRELDAGFDERRQTALAERTTAQQQLSRCGAKRDQLDEAIQATVVDPVLVQNKETVAAFREELGNYKVLKKDLPRRQSELVRLRAEIDTKLAAFTPALSEAAVQALAPALTRRKQIQELVAKRGALEANETSAAEALADAETRLRTCLSAKERAQVGGEANEGQAQERLAELAQAIRAAREVGDVDRRIRNLSARLDATDQDLTDEIAALPYWTGQAEDLRRLPVPSVSTIEAFEAEFAGLARRREKQREALARSEQQLAETTQGLRALELEGRNLPEPQDLDLARRERNEAWNLVRGAWIDNDEAPILRSSFESAEELANRYPELVADADKVADVLRSEASRIASKVDFDARNERLQKELKANAKEADAIDQASQEVERRWADAWTPCDIAPSSPREMLAWQVSREAILTSLAARRDLATEQTTLRDEQTRTRLDLASALARFGIQNDGEPELSGVVARAETVREDFEAKQRKLETLELDLERIREEKRHAESKLEQYRKDLHSWNAQWEQATAGLPLAANSTPVAALDILDALADVGSTREDVRTLELRAERMQEDIESFERSLMTFLERHKLDLPPTPAQQCVEALGQRLEEATANDQHLRALTRERQEQDELIEEAAAQLALSNATLEELATQAGCAETDLPEAFATWQTLVRTRETLDDLERKLTEIGGGRSVADMERDAAGINPDELESRLAALARDIATLDKQRVTLVAEHAEAAVALRAMDGGAAAAEAAQNAEAVLAEIRRETEQYIRLQLAKTILEREIEEYRRSHEAPVLTRASEHFSRMTLGSFSRLTSDFNEHDKPELLGVRPSGDRVGVAGMSAGTRDQLYLALRLASIESFAETSEPMPFIADDILINFDDERTRATLEVLADVGKKIQVLLFSHQGSVRDQAAALQDQQGIRIVDLGAA